MYGQPPASTALKPRSAPRPRAFEDLLHLVGTSSGTVCGISKAAPSRMLGDAPTTGVPAGDQQLHLRLFDHRLDERLPGR